MGYRGTTIISIYSPVTRGHVKPTQSIPSTELHLPCESHPAQRPSITLVGNCSVKGPTITLVDDQSMVSGASEGIDRRLSCFVYFW